MKLYWHKTKNFGDAVSPIVAGYFSGEQAEFINREEPGKLLAMGSILYALRENDVVWGTGSITKDPAPFVQNAKILALRGPLTRECLRQRNKHLEISEIYGDPGILMPLIYNPEVEKTELTGIIPHYIDRKWIKREYGYKIIDITAPWKEVVREIKSCKRIISSSLHGIVIAESFGIPVTWAKYSDNILGGQFKFQDYFLGTGRTKQEYWKEIPPIENLEARQQRLIKAITDFYL